VEKRRDPKVAAPARFDAKDRSSVPGNGSIWPRAIA